MSIYVGVSPKDLGRLQRVLNLFFEQAIGEQTAELPEQSAELKLQVLMVLDEFTALGRLPIFGKSIGFLPGFNVRVLLVVQAISQLREIYTLNGALTMLKALAARIVFAPKDQEDAEALSAELGMTTIKAKSTIRPAWGSGRGPTVSASERARPLMLAQEVKDLGERREIVFYENLRPIRAKKIRYFDDPILKTRIKPPPEVPMIIDPTHPPPRRIPAPEPEQAGRIVEQIPRPARPRAAPIRPRQKPRPGSLLARNPPIDPVVIEAGVSAYLQDFTNNDNSLGDPQATS